MFNIHTHTHAHTVFAYTQPLYQSQAALSLSLSPHSGIFITNLAARNAQLRAQVLDRLCATFPHLLSFTIPEDLNEVLVGFAGEKPYLTRQQTSDTLELTRELRGRVKELVREIQQQATVPTNTGTAAAKTCDLGRELVEHFENARLLSPR